MAKAIAKVGGIALAPGVSRNKRLYTKAHIAGMVARAQSKIDSGNSPVLRERKKPVEEHVISQRTHHAAEDDSTKIVGRVTSISLDESGRARFTAEIADTPEGHKIANLLDTTDGNPPFLRGVSSRMAWLTGARIVRGPDGEPVESGDELDLMGLDYTHKPGVTDANVDTFEWTDGGTRTETDQRVLIYESDLEAHVVSITEATTPATGEASCADQEHACCKATTATETATAVLNHVLVDGFCVTCPVDETAKASKMPHGDVQYADPGYQADKVKRYPLDSSAHIRAAWSYVNVAKNAAKYTAAQLKRIKGRIKAAMGKIGAKVSETAEGWIIFPPVSIGESEVREYYGDDPGRCGSWSINASNGPVSLYLSSYNMDPADLDLILRAAADAACQALKALDPDMDGDIDVPGADAEDTDGDAGKETAPAEPDPADEATETPAPDPAAGETEEKEGTPLASPTETTSTAAGTTPAGTFSQADLDAAVARGIAAADEARRARKAAKRTGQPAETAAGASPVTETTTPAGQAAVTESEDDKVARAVAAKLAEQFPAETDDERIARKVSETFDAEVAKRVAAGSIPVSRRGVVRPANETATGGGGGLNAHGLPDTFPDKPIHKLSAEEFTQHVAPLTGAYVFGDRAKLIK